MNKNQQEPNLQLEIRRVRKVELGQVGGGCGGALSEACQLSTRDLCDEGTQNCYGTVIWKTIEN